MSSSTSSRASASSGFPWSIASVRARWSRRRSISDAIRSIEVARSNAESRPHATEAVFAAAIARRASSLVPSGTEPITSPVEGLTASNVAPLSEGTHSPAMCIRYASAMTLSTVQMREGGPQTALPPPPPHGVGVKPPPQALPLLDRDLLVDRLQVDALTLPNDLRDEIDHQGKQVHRSHEYEGVLVVDRVQVVLEPLPEVESEERGRQQPRQRDQRDPRDLVPSDRRVLVQVLLPPRQ